MSESLIIAVDFDGTLADHKFPDIGKVNGDCFEWLKRFEDAGAQLILYTMRSDERESVKNSPIPCGDRKFLSEAIDFCAEHGVKFWGINTNPTQASWTKSPKAYAHMYIDDAAYGCPLRPGPYPESRPWVDWEVVGPAVMSRLKMGDVGWSHRPLPKQVGDFSRRAQLYTNTLMEHKLREAMLVVEHGPAHVLLTQAVTAVNKAKDLVADYLELPLDQR